MTPTPDHDQPTLDAEFEIHDLRAVHDAQVIAAVRCIGAPVRLGARFRRIRDCAAPIDLELTRIRLFRSDLEELLPVHSALVALRGTGTLLLTPGTPGNGYQIIRGTNPRPHGTRGPRR
ncbi:hypothetical protein ACFW1A_31240 [Kitasatospora sp. NPDC058965]|uniref:hypothetical protein n=1 Tax=Kitasatospora sp. NPDC058965 TaxID=3346682 RepID=UPI0036A5E8CB